MAKPLTVGPISGALVDAPPVYAPGGPVAAAVNLSDDASFSREEIRAFCDSARAMGAVLAVVRCPVAGNSARREALDSLSFTIASAWFTRETPMESGRGAVEPRAATEGDLGEIIRLLSAHRVNLERFSPVFWKRAQNATAVSAAFLPTQIARDDATARVAVRPDGSVAGFGIVVRDYIDDLCIEQASEWPTAGVALIQALTLAANARGFNRLVVVAPDADRAKGDAIVAAGFEKSFRWHVLPLGDI